MQETEPVTSSDDQGPDSLLARLRVDPQAFLGRGGEAWVYALDEDRVVRVLNEGQNPEGILRRQSLVSELRGSRPPFGLPEVLETGDVDGRFYSIERRLPGESVLERLAHLDGPHRAELIEAHLAAAAELRHLHLEARGWYGEILAAGPVRAESWRGFLERRAFASLIRASPEFRSVDVVELCEALPDANGEEFVHLDAFAGNMLAVDCTITAVLDIGETSLVGDGRMDPIAAAVYLAAPQITPAARSADVDVAMSWLRAMGLHQWYEAVRRWLAAYWSFAVDDDRLHDWCRSVLVRP